LRTSLFFLSILPSRYPSSRIVHLIYAPTLPAHTWRVRRLYVLLHPNIFLAFCVPCTSLRSASRGFVSYPKYLVRSLAPCNYAQLYLALRSRGAGSLRAARRTYIYTLAPAIPLTGNTTVEHTVRAARLDVSETGERLPVCRRSSNLDESTSREFRFVPMVESD
jgi:hypothetical protein